MTEQTTAPEPQPNDPSAPVEATGDATGASTGGDAVTVVGGALTDGAYTLFVADFDTTDAAWEAYQGLRAI